MKKNILVFAFSTMAALALNSCHDPIYEMIDVEVPIERYGIAGSITSMSPVGNTLFITNGRIYSRDISSPSTNDETTWNKNWTRVLDPSKKEESFYGNKISYIAGDANYLYAITTEWGEDYLSYNIENKRHLIVSSDLGQTFTEIDLSSLYDTSLEETLETKKQDLSVKALNIIFSNNAQNPASRNAYVRLNNSTVYKLNGTSTPVAVSANGAGGKTVSCVNYKGSDYFSNYYAITANDTYIYFAENAKTIKYADSYLAGKGLVLSGTEEAGSAKAGTANIYSLAATKDYLLVGTVSGAFQVGLGTDDKPEDTTTAPNSNMNSILSSSFQINPFYVLDPTQNIQNTDIWAAKKIRGSFSNSTHGLFSEIGLYAYYPSRGTWNTDGTADESSKGN